MLCEQIRRGLLSIRFLLVLALAVFMAVFQWWTMRHAGYRMPYHQPTFLDETLLFSGAGDIFLDSSLIPSPPIMPQDRARVDDP